MLKKTNGITTSLFAKRNVLASTIALTFAISGCGSDSDNTIELEDLLEANLDTTPPVITLTGDNPVTIAHGSTYVDAGATATDDVDGTVTVSDNASSIDTTSLGEQTVTYSASDTAGNSAQATRTVNVADLTPPVITLTGDAVVELFVNDTYTDAGATATDNIDTTVTVTSTNDLDASMAGTYTYTYSAMDAAGNDATDVTRTINVTAPVLTGTAAAGAAIVGTVTVKDALGNSRSAVIEADGSYSVDVSGLTAPFRLRAEGTVGGKTYKLHSYAESATPESTVNITPFTDLIISNAAQQIAEEFFDEATPTALDPEEIDEQEDALQAKLQDVFDAVGLGTAIDLLNMSFSADHSGLDAALDLITIETDPDTNVATITNVINDSQIVDDIQDTEDNDTTIVIEEDEVADVTETVTDTIAIAGVFESFGDLFVGGLPTSEALSALLADSFLHHDQSKSQFVTDVTTDPTVVDISFTSVSIRDLDSDAGTAVVDFNVRFDDFIEAKPETWQVIKVGDSWKLEGNQLAIEADTLSPHCNDWDGTDSATGSCGFNVSFYDNDFSNNGTNGEAFASATATIYNADMDTVKGMVYLGSSDFAGEIHVYNPANGAYQGDWWPFGSGTGELDPSVLAVGDVIEYKVYESALDLSNPESPMVVGDADITFTETLLHLPATQGLYPSVTSETLTAMTNYVPTQDLTVVWDLADGTLIDSVLVEVYDNEDNYYEIEEELLGTEQTSIDIDVSSLFTDGTVDQDNFTLLVRVYALEEQTGQLHSTDFRTEFVDDGTGGENGGENGGSGTSLTCDTVSAWDDVNDKPIDFYSIDDFETVIADCESNATLPDISVSDLADATWYLDDEMWEFSADGTAISITDFGDDETAGTGDDETFFASVSLYDTNILQFEFSETQGGTVIGVDLVRVVGETTFGGVDVYETVTLWEYYEWTESDDTLTDTSHAGGEIYDSVYALASDFDWDAWESGVEPADPDAALTCDTESAWDDVNDKPIDFYSIDDFETVIADCATGTSLPNFSVSELANLTWYVDDERVVFSADGTSLEITSYGDDETLGTADDETFYGTVTQYDTNILQFLYSETQGGTVLGIDLIRITGESSFNGDGYYDAVTLWEYFEWTESDGDISDTSHQGAEIYQTIYALDSDFDWDAWDAQ